MKKITIILVLFALVLTACESTGAKSESKNEITKITPSPDQNTLNLGLDKGTPLPDGVVAVFQRSGGFVGKTEQWSIYADGKIVKGNGETSSVEAALVTTLLGAADTAGFFDMETSKIGSVSNCNDCYTYQLTMTYNGKSNTIQAQEGAKGLPDAFWALIKQINTLITPPVK